MVLPSLRAALAMATAAEARRGGALENARRGGALGLSQRARAPVSSRAARRSARPLRTERGRAARAAGSYGCAPRSPRPVQDAEAPLHPFAVHHQRQRLERVGVHRRRQAAPGLDQGRALAGPGVPRPRQAAAEPAVAARARPPAVAQDAGDELRGRRRAGSDGEFLRVAVVVVGLRAGSTRFRVDFGGSIITSTLTAFVILISGLVSLIFNMKPW